MNISCTFDNLKKPCLGVASGFAENHAQHESQQCLPDDSAYETVSENSNVITIGRGMGEF